MVSVIDAAPEAVGSRFVRVMPRTEYGVNFGGDGETDDSPERIEGLAALGKFIAGKELAVVERVRFVDEQTVLVESLGVRAVEGVPGEFAVVPVVVEDGNVVASQDGKIMTGAELGAPTRSIFGPFLYETAYGNTGQ